jgi:hypothetical protein
MEENYCILAKKKQMCLEKEKQLTRGNEFEIEHIDPQSIPKDLAILIEINISSTLLEVR